MAPGQDAGKLAIGAEGDEDLARSGLSRRPRETETLRCSTIHRMGDQVGPLHLRPAGAR